ncbi:enoyl-CoA hydratase/isomerase family protein [Streptomyces sp. S1D4-11]|nr:enoyl-CoA hydratase/isomerase family protein [Streptomyces sp. S1D4-11]QIZ01117.1 enoyl-CoA hydratase/isomerase family protein [Streptomyces sp. S1D4-11]
MNNIGLEVRSGVATVTLRKPPDNRFDGPMVEEFDKALDEVISRNARALVLAGDGPDFCHGGDIVPWEKLGPGEWAAQLGRFAQVFNRIEHLPIPVIAAVQGLCNGGAFELVLRADLIFAGKSARFSSSEQTLGLVTALGGVQRLAERVGRSLAYQWVLTSEQIPAEVLERHGAVNRVIDEAELLPEATRFAEKLAKGATLAHGAHKTLLRSWAIGGIAAADDIMPDVFMPLLKSEDWKRGLQNGIAAYLAGKPRPELDFEGR